MYGVSTATYPVGNDSNLPFSKSARARIGPPTFTTDMKISKYIFTLWCKINQKDKFIFTLNSTASNNKKKEEEEF
jgi:hypothetical protein